MSDVFKAVQISDHVWWVGAIDWTLQDFHGYATPSGSTYNAYLILGGKITLVDTVKAPFRSEMLARVMSVVEPREISYIISNHSEMDHTGCLPEIIELAKPEKVFASAMGVKALADYYHLDKITAVKDGESLKLGDLTLTFTETRMLHWPDSMFSYLEEDKLLFSQDAFGMHLASRERFADEIAHGVLESEAARYYANILMPFSPRITKLLEKVKTSGIPFDLIAPDHGPVWRREQDRQWILDRYGCWAAKKPTRKAVVVFDTMWGSTEKMALAICEGLAAGGTEVKYMPLRKYSRSDVATEVLEAGALLVGSPTLNDGLFPTVADVLTYLKGLKPANLIGAAFGSYGWNGTAVEEIKSILTVMKVALVSDGLKIRYLPDKTTIQECYALGLQTAHKLAEVAAP
ncbi:FprA family A-type flavoprotein [candidate division KSB1 bacterium]|nr:MAG: FprA family A-type flavoprotein [candidate division KSB1 bacterium]